jgi:hypothetical protein
MNAFVKKRSLWKRNVFKSDSKNREYYREVFCVFFYYLQTLRRNKIKSLSCNIQNWILYSFEWFISKGRRLENTFFFDRPTDRQTDRQTHREMKFELMIQSIVGNHVMMLNIKDAIKSPQQRSRQEKMTFFWSDPHLTQLHYPSKVIFFPLKCISISERDSWTRNSSVNF